MLPLENMNSGYRWLEVYTAPWILTGNVAKIKVLHELHRLISCGSGLSILDIGCVGPEPLEFWKPLLNKDSSSFHLTGIDVWGVENARKVVEQQAWENSVTLQQGSGYQLGELFPEESFDVVIATQVLEHVALLSLFMRQAASVLKTGGQAFFTIDSANWRPRFDPQYPVRYVKNLIKKGISLVGNEKHYDLPWFDHELITVCENSGLKVIECRYYNLAPLKFIHNKIIPPSRKNAFMRLWLELEEFLNEEKSVREKTKHFFMGIYLHVCKF